MSFPKKVSQVAFNKEIKTLCKLAGIDEWISGFKNNPNSAKKL